MSVVNSSLFGCVHRRCIQRCSLGTLDTGLARGPPLERLEAECQPVRCGAAVQPLQASLHIITRQEQLAEEEGEALGIKEWRRNRGLREDVRLVHRLQQLEALPRHRGICFGIL